MKVRESGMPNEKIWESFFKPESILQILKLNHNVIDVVELGCGYGTFTIPAAKMIQGKMYAIDIGQEMINLVFKKARDENLDNLKTIHRDFIQEGSGLSDKSVDYVMLFNILHTENPEELLKES